MKHNVRFNKHKMSIKLYEKMVLLKETRVHIHLFRRKFEVLCNSLHPLLSDHHCLRSSKSTKGSIRRQASETHFTNCTIVGYVVDTIGIC